MAKTKKVTVSMTTDKQKATLYRMQKGGLKLARTDGDNLILQKNGIEVAKILPNGHVFSITDKQ